ncbi:MAG: aromatic amino acid lyase, partial [Parcubacteria group bacterium]
MSIQLDGGSLTVDHVLRIARHHERVDISEGARMNLIKAREFVDRKVKESKVIYGITTGFGSFKNVSIDIEQTKQLQRNLIMSHSIGVGDPLPEECVRASILVRVNSLLRGYSGVRPVVVDTLVALLNKDVYPFVPSKGSVG